MAVIVRKIPAYVYAGLMNDLPNLRQSLVDQIIVYQSAADSQDILRFHNVLINKRDFITVATTVRGIGAYAKAQEDNPAYDIGAQMTALIAALTSATDFIEKNFPASTYLTFNATTDKPVYTTIPAAQLATYRTRLQAIVNLIDISEL